ncbi:MAG TPA: LysR substrate-binding domain-containing protein, partial [Candidatus Deferrimicrobium sp.]
MSPESRRCPGGPCGWGRGGGARIREAYPSLALEVRNQRDMESFDQLLAGELDLAVRSREALPHGLRFEPLFASDRMLIVPRGHELAGKKRPTFRNPGLCGL